MTTTNVIHTVKFQSSRDDLSEEDMMLMHLLATLHRLTPPDGIYTVTPDAELELAALDFTDGRVSEPVGHLHLNSAQIVVTPDSAFAHESLITGLEDAGWEVVTAERLHRPTCPQCGGRGTTAVEESPGLARIVECSLCGGGGVL